jgi:UDP-glucose 4-epimerase
MPYTSVLALMGKVRCPLPGFVARPLARALWATQLSGAPPALIDFLRYACVADGSRARKELGFAAEIDIQRTIFDFLGVADPEVDVNEVYG